MAIQLVFSKSDDTPWGFRLTGGADCEIPLTVIKVAKGGIAETAGLQVDDVILKINERVTENLSHIEAYDVLMDAGQSFTMTVIRDYTNPLHEDEQHNEEVRNILEQVAACDQTDNFHPEMEQDDHQEQVTGIENSIETQPQSKNLRVRFEEPTKEEVEQKGQLLDIQQKKWSTFLQKPNRPKVLPKRDDLEKPIAEPYKVIIKKQPKKNVKKDDKEERVEESPTIIEPQGAILEDIENVEEENFVEDEETQEVIKLEEDEEEEDQFNADIDEEYGENTQDETDYTEEVEFEKQLSMEERLAQIQQQLQLLAHVPSSIQDTLEVLTEQLAKIVGVSQTERYEEQQIVSDAENNEDDEEHSYEDDNMPSTVEENVQANDSCDEYKLDITDTTDISEDEADTSTQECNIISPEDELKLKREEEAEKGRQQEELEKSAKLERTTMQTEEFHQRRLEQRPTVPLAPVQRPIILPGGRKWSEPDDAIPKPRKSKMTDEKICETLDNCAEVVMGHTKGINFLKYQPPPKNLDYLQRSEVFRLVHDMDPPKTGISSRSGLVVSEEDYYNTNVGQRMPMKV